MMTRTRYVVLALAIIVSLHYILSFSHEGYGNATSFEALSSKFNLGGQAPPGPQDGKVWHEPPYKTPVPEKYYLQPNGTITRKANAAIVMLARNSDLGGMVKSMSQLEAKFNARFGYPYVFLNEVPFSDEFKRTVSALTQNTLEFGLIPHEHWFQPPEIDEARAAAARKDMQDVIYGGAVPYRNMCRFNSGFFYRHELLQKYRYYWRLDPDVRFFCTLDYDPFLFMQDEGKKYGFTIALPEYERTIPTLWAAVREFVEANPGLVAPDNAMGFLSDDGGESYNNCHFWSNFEIADLDLWRGEAYTKFFDHLDAKGGFYYERWGDAPVHSIGAALFARKDQIHFFEDIGYRHEPFQHCPQAPAHGRGQCECDITNNFDRDGWSCLNRYDRIFT
ncbi:glycosyltransferase family 15 protein [Mycena rosella]|uniref:Glycosyltransferase family 15 protein n=1 Tax=Mycena rosella TaxID=1033263 RepID=A0AAD7DJE0_MYCRO|nr:glycosyltransferase family 15 protein [Mycena rosella]